MSCLEYAPISFADLRDGCDYYERRPHYTRTLQDFRTYIREQVEGGESAGGLDLSLLEPRQKLVDWLNSWGCMLPKTDRVWRCRTLGEIEKWWLRWHTTLPTVSLGSFDELASWVAAVHETPALLRYPDQRPERVAHAMDAYGDLGKRNVRPGAFGYVGASKTLFLLRPNLFVAWDGKMMAKYGYRQGLPFQYMFFLDEVRTMLGDVASLCVLTHSSLADLPKDLGRKHAHCTLPEVLNKYLFARAHGYRPAE